MTPEIGKDLLDVKDEQNWDNETAEPTEWIVNLGASNRVVQDRDNLINLISYNNNEFIMVGSGEYVPITCSGKTFLIGKSSILLHEVFVVHEIKRHLIFIS